MAGKFRMHTDGACRGNPGLASVGVVIYDEEGKAVKKISSTLGTTTNNQAEYLALIAGLKAALQLSPDHLDVFMDSQLVIQQMKGVFKVNSGLSDLNNEARILVSNLKHFSFNYVPREKNQEADRLANLALDQRGEII